MPKFDPVQLIAAIKTLLPIVPWLERSNLEYKEQKNQLEKIRQKLTQNIGTAEKLGDKVNQTELQTSIVTLKSLEELIEKGRKQNESDNR